MSVQELTVIDLETTGLNPQVHLIHGIGIMAGRGHTAGYFKPTDPLYINGGPILGHNIRYDYKFLAKAGIQLKGPLYCTLALAQLLNESDKLNLGFLTKKYLGVDETNKDTIAKFMQQVGVPSVDRLCMLDLTQPSQPYRETIAQYCKEDCSNTLKLWENQRARLEKLHKQLKIWGYKKTPADYFIEEVVPMEKVLADMELRGIRINNKQLDEFQKKLKLDESNLTSYLQEHCAENIVMVEEDLYQLALSKRKSERGQGNVQRASEKYKTKFNWDSNQHVGVLFYGKFGIPKHLWHHTKGGQLDVSEEQLWRVFRELPETHKLHEILRNFLAYKKLQKLLTTYIGEEKGLVSHVLKGRIYPEFIQGGGPVTGRLASRHPNVQNLPRSYPEIKRFFIPDEGEVFAYFDYSQIELRLAAHLSQDKMMLKAYKEGLDLHQLTADKAGVERQMGKTLNFAMIYGASPYRLHAEFEGKFSIDDCGDFRNAFFELYHGYAQYLKRQESLLRQNGFVVSMFGRLRRLPEFKLASLGTKEYRHALNQGVNFPIQSAAASICKRAMIQLADAGYKLVNQVHDSVIIALPTNQIEKIKDIQRIAEGIVTLSIPLKAEVKILNSFDEGDVYESKPTADTNR